MDDENIAHRINLSTGPDSSNFETQGSTIKSASNDDRIGELIAGKYKIIEKLGQGGMGTVYKVEQVLLSKICALKLISSNVSSIHLRRFQIEAKAAAQLEHANTIKTLDFGMTDDGVAYIVMEYADGITLSDHLRKHGPLSIEDTLGIFIPLCHALDEAHSKGIVHRDIKPSNILLVKKDNALVGKLADFGVARLTASDEVNALTRTGEIIGSPLYMSPEQCSTQPVDSRSDIYSFGCTLFESLTGAPPFTGSSMLETITKHTNEEPPTLKQASMGQDFPEELEKLMANLLEKRREKRPQSMAQVAAHLTAIERGTEFLVPVFDRRAKPAPSKVSDKVLVICGTCILLIMAITWGTITFIGGESSKSEKSSSIDTSAESDPVANHLSIPQRQKGYYSTIKHGGTASEVRVFHFDSNPRKTIGNFLQGETKFIGFGTQTIKWDKRKLLRFEPTYDFVASTPENFARFREDEIFALDFDSKCEISREATFAIHSLKSLGQFNSRGAEITDEALYQLRDLPNLSTLDVRHSKVTGVGLADLKAINSLTYLRTSELTHVKECLEWLQHCPRLEALELMNCDELTDQSLKEIGKLEGLKCLSISGCTKVTDIGLRHLKQLKKLEKLNIELTQISKNSIPILASFPKLDVLSVSEGFVATHEREELRSSLPNCSSINFLHKEADAMVKID